MGRRKLNDLMEQIGMQLSLTGRIERSRMMWADHWVRVDDLRTDFVKQPGLGKRGIYAIIHI